MVFLGHLIGQHDELRTIAVNAFGNLSKQCSDPDAIGKLINVLGDVLYGKYIVATKQSQVCFYNSISINLRLC